MTLTIQQPPSLLAFEGNFGPFQARTSYLLEPTADGTKLTNRMRLEPASAPLRLISPLAIPRIKAAVAGNLRTLKRILETAEPEG